MLAYAPTGIHSHWEEHLIMKLKTMTWLGIAGCFTGVAALISACGSDGQVSASGGSAICGNAIVETGEECDDGNSNDSDGCTNVCGKGSTSSNMQMSGSGGSTSSGGNTCGNGKLDQGEDCDDGNDVDSDTCRNNCTSNAPTTCGNGMVDVGEQCDDGNKVPDDDCSNVCGKPACGDGIVQKGEDCDDGKNNGEFGSKCPKDCMNPKMATSSTVDPCMGTKVFAAVVSNAANPATMGSGIAPKWAYNGLEGLQAGTVMCQAVGADHVCNYDEVVKAEANGELSALPDGLTYWLHRTTAVVNPVLNKACAVDNDCTGANTLPYCDPVKKMCAYKAGAGGRCNDWTYPTGHISDGEWFATKNNNAGKNSGGVMTGNLVYHFDGDTFYDGVSQSHLCKSETTLGCSGACAGANRAILCCFPVCK